MTRQRRRRKRDNTFSWKRLLGITRVKQEFARQTGIPTTKAGMERKVGRLVTKGGCFILLFILAVIAYGVLWVLEKNGIIEDKSIFFNW